MTQEIKNMIEEAREHKGITEEDVDMDTGEEIKEIVTSSWKWLTNSDHAQVIDEFDLGSDVVLKLYQLASDDIYVIYSNDPAEVVKHVYFEEGEARRDFRTIRDYYIETFNLK